MKVLQRYYSASLAWMHEHTWITGTAAVVVLFILYRAFFGGAQSQMQTIVAAPGDLVASIAVAGTVVAAQDVDLGFAKGGRIASVPVKAGQRVSRGATLASVENGDARAALLQRQAALESARARYSSVAGGTRAEELAIAQDEVDSARASLVDTLLDAYRAADNAVRNDTNELFNNPRTTASFLFAASNSRYNKLASRSRKELEQVLALWQTSQAGLSISSDLEAAVALAKANLTEVTQFLTYLNLALADAEPDQGYATQAQLAAYIADVAAARTAIGAMQATLNSEVAALTNAQKSLALKQAGATSQDIAIEAAQVKAAQADVAAAQAELNKTIILAPFDGVVSKVDAKVGAIASANEPLISMLSEGSFQIEAYVPEINISTLHLGDKATTTLDAYGHSEYFAATVVAIDPAETVRGGVSNYKTTLQFDKADDRIRSGMTANITITTDVRKNVIAIPQGAVILRGAERLVQVMEGKNIVERPVVLGASSMLGNIEIVSGLNNGDLVVLSPAI